MFRNGDVYFAAFLDANGSTLTLYPASAVATVLYRVGAFTITWTSDPVPRR